MTGRTGRLVAAMVVSSLSAGCIVFDASNVAKNTLIKINHTMQMAEQVDQNAMFRRFNRSMDIVAPLNRYEMPDPPRMRTRWPDYLLTGVRSFVDTLNAGEDALNGLAAYGNVVTPLRDLPNDFRTIPWLSEDGREGVRRQIAVIEYADSVNRMAVDMSGRIRGSRRGIRETLALLESIVTIGSSATKATQKVATGLAVLNQQQNDIGNLRMSMVNLIAVDATQEREAKAASTSFALGAMEAAQWGSLNASIDDPLDHLVLR